MAKILIIEDNPANMQLATDLLEVHGHEVISADRAEEGLELARSQRPDLILCDIGLPGMDGIEAVRCLRQDPAIGHITAVALTAHAMVGDRDKALEAGFNGYLTKPINTRRFVPEVLAFLADEEAAGRGDHTAESSH